MYLSPTELQHSRLASLDNLHHASLSGLEATERLAQLALGSGRRALDEGHRHLAALAAGEEPGQAALPLERLTEWRAESAERVREYFEIIGAAQHAMLKMARDQLAVLDQAFMKQMDHAARSADAQGAAAIDHVRGAVRQAEAGFNELAEAAVRGSELVEEQVRQVSEALASGAPVEDSETEGSVRKRLPRSK